MFFLTVIPFRRSNHISTFLRFIEYTCLAFASIEVLIYIIEPRIPCNDFFSKCWVVESNPVGAWVLLKLYISSSPFLAIHCSLWTNHSLQPLKTCNYHHHPCSTQQLFYEVEIICFSLFFMTQQTVMMLVSLAGQIVYSTAISDVNDKLMDFCCLILFSAISMILLKRMCQFCATGVKSSAFCTNISHLQFIQLWNATNFSTLYSVQNRFFSTRLRQYGLLSRHLLVLQ